MEIDISKIKPFSFWDILLYGSRGAKGVTKYPYIYFHKVIYDDLISTNPNPINIAMVLHEFEHIKRMDQIGKSKFKLKYLFSGQFRLQEEIEADKPRFKYLKKLNIKPDLDNRAKILSGAVYFWMISYKKALELLQKTWDDI